MQYASPFVCTISYQEKKEQKSRIMQRKIRLFPMTLSGLAALLENVKNMSLKITS